MKNPTVSIGSIFALTVGLALTPPGALAGDVVEVEPNNMIDSAQNIDQDFGVGLNADIQDSELWPWVSIGATGDGTFDYYSFEVPAAGVTGVFDIDYGYFGTGSIDTKICLYDPSDGSLLASNDDSSAALGALGSHYAGLDPYISYTFAAPGTYVVGVGKYSSFCDANGLSGTAPEAGTNYVLQVSLSEHVSPVVPAAPVSSVPLVVDSDGDGVPDESDSFPFSDMNPTVVFEGCDSGVANTQYDDGSTLSDRLHDCADDAKNHGAFTRCVAKLANRLKKAGEIRSSDKGMLQSCAAQSGVGKKQKDHSH